MIGALTIGCGAAVAAVVASGVPRPRLQPAPANLVVPLVAVAFALGVAGLITASVCALALAVLLPLARAVEARARSTRRGDRPRVS